MEAVNPGLFDGLNEAQRQAVETTEGPLLVLAGAGTGKTRVLTSRIAYILQQNLAYPSQILAVTFTNKAAKEMQLRINDMAGGQSAGLWLGTFHSIALRIIRRHTDKIGFKPDFAIIDADDQLRLIKRIINENNMDEKRTPPKAIAAVIQRWKDRALTPDKIHDGGHNKSDAEKIYKLYQTRLHTINAMDFGDLLLHCINLFTNHTDVIADYHRRFRYILVDEYQDTNVAQYLWLRLLAQGNRNICCVGDDDQSIYGWRGAEVENILRFEKDFSGAQVIRLEQNYRSTPDILAAASALIENNKGRLGKTLYSESGNGEKIKLVSLWDEKKEAEYVGSEIEALQQFKQHSLNDIAILVRAGFQTRAFEESFISMGIPYKVLGGLRFYERMEIRDAIAYIRAVVQPGNDLALERIINVPKRGIGGSTVESLREHARAGGVPLSQAAQEKIANGDMRPAVVSKLGGLMANFRRWREMFTTHPHAEVVNTILNESGYMQMWKQDKSPEAEGRVENLKELLAALEDFESIEQFLEHVSLVMDGDDVVSSDMVSVMTIHGAKGLEFDTVFLTGWEEGLFPSQKSMDEKGQEGLEEERRLAYVGVTRARRRLYITFAGNRRVYGKWLSSIPSRFIDELPVEYIEEVNNAGFRGQKSGARNQKSDNFIIEGLAEDGIPFVPEGKFRTGERVFHQKFGYGRITEISGKHLKINFEKSSPKTLMEDYVEKVG